MQHRAGIVVPTGIATDATTANFFTHLVESNKLSQLIDFENRAGLFPAVESRQKFSLLSIGPNESEARFSFYLTDPNQLAESERQFSLSAKEIAIFNPNSHTVPVIRSRYDLELMRKIYQSTSVMIRKQPAHPDGDG